MKVLACLTTLCVGLVASRAHAQACVTCSPLSMPATSTSAAGGAPEDREFSASARLNAGWLSFPSQTVLGERFDDPNRARVDVGLLALEAGLEHQSGFGGTVVLPAALLSGVDVSGARVDPGLGDLEARGSCQLLLGPTLGASFLAGAALPTGRYAPRSGALALTSAASALTPGRGAVWGLADANLRWQPTARLVLLASVGGRLPVTDAPDGFRWAGEVRGLVDAQVALAPDRFFAGATLEAQWRGVSSVIDPFQNQRIASENTGGVVLAVSPTVSARLPHGVFVQASLRVPLFQRLEGLQFNQGLGAFVAVGVALPWGRTRAEVSRAGRWTVTDYDASWCVACQELRPLLAQAEARHGAVRFERVDVTAWSQEELERAVPGATALPVIEIRRPDGTLAARLEGEVAAHFETRLQELNR